MPQNTSTSNQINTACGDYHTGLITTTASAAYTPLTRINTTGSSNIAIGSSNTIATVATNYLHVGDYNSYNTGALTVSTPVYGKLNDIYIQGDGETVMICDENGVWVTYEVESMSIKKVDGRKTLFVELSKYKCISKLYEERKSRKVLTEKLEKPKPLTWMSGTTGTYIGGVDLALNGKGLHGLSTTIICQHISQRQEQ
jgi:hypothetical protein